MDKLNKNLKRLIAVRKCYCLCKVLPIINYVLNALTVHTKDQNGEHWYISKNNTKTRHVNYNKTKEWIIPGMYHRINGPAHISKESIIYYLFGKLHRDVGPAIIHMNKNKTYDKMLWYYNGKLHRDDFSINGNVGPAVIWKNTFREWYKHGILHRENGPARIWPDGSYEWRIDGILHRDDFSTCGKVNGPVIKSIKYKYEAWYKNGKKHRIDGPAIIFKNGSYEWWLSGYLHRVNGPAIFLNAGPVEHSNFDNRKPDVRPTCSAEWWIFGKKITTTTSILNPPKTIL